MPLFEYHCFACDKIFETLVTDSSEVVSCNICKSLNVKKVFSVFGVTSSNDGFNEKENISSHECNASCCCCN